MSEIEQYIPHLLELRKRALRSCLAFILVFLPFMFYSNKLYTFIAQPILSVLPKGSSLIATAVVTPFTVPLKLAFFATLVVVVPYILYQGWAFVAPGLYPKEKRLIAPIFLISTCLFYIGIAFAHFFVCPLTLSFFAYIVPEGVTVMTDLSHYLDFVLLLYGAFGLAFQVPVITFVLLMAGVTTIDSLTKKRPYIIVGAFTVGMLLTPPDVVSQVCLAIPLWFLFESGVLLARWLLPQPKAASKELSL